MAKDERLYARFDIGLPDSEKILPLSDKAFRAFFEAIFYSRTQLTDGFLADAVVRKKWGLKVAAELTSNHSERPSWFPVEGGWQIHDYDKHQTTRADIEAKRDAGRKGGLARAERYQTASTPLAGANQNPGTMLAKTETETETETKQEQKISSEIAEAIPRPEIITLLDILDSEIKRNGAKPPSRTKHNIDAARLMLDRDGRTVEQVTAAIRWCQADEFWRSNILSMSKLREKYDQIRLDAERKRGPGKPTRGQEHLAYIASLDRREVAS